MKSARWGGIGLVTLALAACSSSSSPSGQGGSDSGSDSGSGSSGGGSSSGGSSGSSSGSSSGGSGGGCASTGPYVGTASLTYAGNTYSCLVYAAYGGMMTLHFQDPPGGGAGNIGVQLDPGNAGLVVGTHPSTGGHFLFKGATYTDCPGSTTDGSVMLNSSSTTEAGMSYGGTFAGHFCDMNSASTMVDITGSFALMQ